LNTCGNSLGALISNNSLLASVHHDKHLGRVLPLGPLDKLQRVRVCDGEVLAQDLDIVDRLLQVVVDVLFDGQDSFLLVRVLELLRQLIHSQVLVFIVKWHQFELKVYVVVRRRLLGRLCLL